MEMIFNSHANKEENLLCHFAMVAKFLDPTNTGPANMAAMPINALASFFADEPKYNSKSVRGPNRPKDCRCPVSPSLYQALGQCRQAKKNSRESPPFPTFKKRKKLN